MRHGLGTYLTQYWHADSTLMVACSTIDIYITEYSWTLTMFATTISWCGNKCTPKHRTLSLIFQCESVPPLVVVDSSKKQTLCKVHQKHWDADCVKKVTEPYSPLHNTNKHKIKKLKEEVFHKLLLTNMLCRLLDDCLGYEAYVYANIQPMAFSSYTKRYPKLWWLARLPTSVNFVRLFNLSGSCFALPTSLSQKIHWCSENILAHLLMWSGPDCQDSEPNRGCC